MRGSAMMGEEVASGFEGIEGNGHRMAQKRGNDRGRRPFGPRPRWGRQPPKAPIWEAAAFFSTAASTGAS